ncbi:MAG TPA: restriction endonuclease subunit S, partial [Caldisericia bacterium]|nr:restriction endonuclease subunit S [Caldisericia bacterium]
KDGTVGKLAYISYLPDKTSLNSHLLLLRPKNSKFINKFLFWVLSSENFKIYIGLSQDGTIMESLSQEKISNFSFSLPPLPEQQAIADYLDKKCAQIDQTIELKEKLIEKLSDYKKSLIYECVTGKREVKTA